MNGAELLLDALEKEGVTHFFNNPGLGSWGVVDALASRSFEYVLALHEGSLVSIADGFARASGRPTFVSLYMMPGTANAMSAMYIARQDRSPLVVSATNQMRSMVGRDPYATTDDFLAMAGSVTKWCHEVSKPERLPEAIHRAFSISMTPPRGPVFLSMPHDILPALPEGPVSEPSRPTAPPTLGGVDPSVLERLVSRLVDAERPAIVVGKDVNERLAVDTIVALAELVGAPVLHEEWTMTVAFPNRHPLSLGEATFGGQPDLLKRLGTDYLLHIGARIFPEVSAPLAPLPAGLEVDAIAENGRDLGRSCVLGYACIADVGIAARQLLDAYPRAGDDGKKKQRLARAAEVRADQEKARIALVTDTADDRGSVAPSGLFEVVNKVITADTLIVEHTTTNIGQFRAHIDVTKPQNIFGTASSNQGWGLPASVGVQMARPNEPVLAIIGDGGFSFTPQALWTAFRRNVPVTVVVLNNRGYKATRWGAANYPRITAAGLEEDFDFWFDVDATKIAQGFGVSAVKVSNARDAGDAIAAGLASNEPNVIEVMVTP